MQVNNADGLLKVCLFMVIVMGAPLLTWSIRSEYAQLAIKEAAIDQHNIHVYYFHRKWI